MVNARVHSRSVSAREGAFDIVAKDRNYQTQYANIYFLRLAALKPGLRSLATERWSAHATETGRVLDVVQGDLTWIVGTIYMDMPLKPQVLQDLVADINLAAAVPAKAWRDVQRDSIQLEDESGRLTIVGHKLDEHILCTGVVVAALGTETASGEFDVIDILFPAQVDSLEVNAYQNTALSFFDDRSVNGAATTNSAQEAANDQYIAVTSGLELSDGESSSLQLDLLAEFLSGELFGSASHNQVSKISSLLIVGNSTGITTTSSDDAMSRRLAKNKKYGYDSAAYNARPIELLDAFIEDICNSIDVVLIPGEQDPTNITLPQKAINRIMLSKSARYTSSSLKLASNPAYLQMAERNLFCSAGQTIDNLKHYIASDASMDGEQPPSASIADDNSSLDLAQETLRWAHLAPTAPDTLWTYPFADRDPFIMEQAPEVYIIGNQDKFAQRLVRVDASGSSSNCNIVTIPKFSTTNEIVLINLKTLHAQSINFSVMTET